PTFRPHDCDRPTLSLPREKRDTCESPVSTAGSRRGRVSLGCTDVERSLNENDRFAAELRHRFEAASLLCLNVISSRGSGKTTLLERPLRDLPEGARAAVLTDDIKTDTESRRIARAGHIVKPMSIGGASHLDAARVTRALDDCQLDGVDFLFIENVGTLDRASGVDLGEHAKIVLLSVTEADDTPGRFPDIYRHAGLARITKSTVRAGA